MPTSTSALALLLPSSYYSGAPPKMMCCCLLVICLLVIGRFQSRAVLPRASCRCFGNDMCRHSQSWLHVSSHVLQQDVECMLTACCPQERKGVSKQGLTIKRLLGSEVSPELWDKVSRSLLQQLVQLLHTFSVTLRLCVSESLAATAPASCLHCSIKL